jgi:polysaccharide deacetylase family protein (PEP-CTERM system associated)
VECQLKKLKKEIKMNILTFDVEDWFHVLDNPETKDEKQWIQLESRIHQNMDKIFDLLEKNDQKATFFTIGWIARKYPEIIKNIDSRGHEIASHSDMHQLAYEFNREEFRQDLEISVKSIEDITGKKVRAYRAPGFSVKKENKWVFEELINNGIEIDCSVFPAKRAHGGFEEFGYAEPAYIEMNGSKIKEFPINTYSVLGKNIIFSGGGYFRLIPYPLMRHFMNNSKYVMTYLHPRDFDPEQPMIEGLSAFRRFKSYIGLKSTSSKLDRLLNDFDFTDLQEADSMIEWNDVKVLKL